MATPGNEDGMITVSVKQLDGMTFNVSVMYSATVGELKLAILAEREIPPERQRLIFRAQELKVDGKALSEYGIFDRATLHIVIRPVGQEVHSGQYNPPNDSHVVSMPAYLPPGPDGAAQQPGQDNNNNNNGGNTGLWGVDPNAIAISRLCRFVRIFALIDGIFLLLIGLSFYPIIVLACFAMAGYFGAKRLQNNYLILYMICLLAEMGFRAYFMFYPKTKAYEAVLYALMILIDIFVLKCVIQLYKAIPTLDQQTREQVLVHNSMGLF